MIEESRSFISLLSINTNKIINAIAGTNITRNVLAPEAAKTYLVRRDGTAATIITAASLMNSLGGNTEATDNFSDLALIVSITNAVRKLIDTAPAAAPTYPNTISPKRLATPLRISEEIETASTFLVLPLAVNTNVDERKVVPYVIKYRTNTGVPAIYFSPYSTLTASGETIARHAARGHTRRQPDLM